MRDEIKVCLVRHGKTPGNIRRGYIGCRTDEDLAETGKAELQKYARGGIYPEMEYLFLSPMKRCRQTAEIVWPGLLEEGRFQVVNDLRECDFGDFDGKSYAELDGVPDFQHWVDSDGNGAFPNGEDPKDFRKRSTEAFLGCLDRIVKMDIGSAAFSVHGGTVMSVLTRFGVPEKGYYDWHVWNGDGYECTIRREEWERTHHFSKVRKLLPEEEKKA